MINLKYYIFLMIGIFLALGLGMMIGIALEDKNFIENQQALMIKQIEESILSYKSETEDLKEDIRNLQNDNAQLSHIASIMLNETISEKLSGINVALVSFDE